MECLVLAECGTALVRPSEISRRRPAPEVTIGQPILERNIRRGPIRSDDEALLYVYERIKFYHCG